MTLVWLILVLAWPLIEIAVLIKVGTWLGFWSTLGLVVASGVLGGAVLMRHGLDAALKVQAAMARGEAPLLAMMDGALVATAGLLLVVPGLCADVVGLLLLVPPLRAFVARYLLRSMLGLDEVGLGDVPRRGRPPGPQDTQRPSEGPIIEGEFERLEERTMEPKRDRRDGVRE